MRNASLSFLAVLCCGSFAAEPEPGDGRSLETVLASEDPAALVRAARELGDANRGALLFFQQGLACAKCHVAADGRPSIGPDVAKLGKETSAADLVDAVLRPSKMIRKGYEPLTIATEDGRSVTGILVEERPDAVVLRDPSRDDALTILKSKIEARKSTGISLMPAGLVNQLSSRSQFLDLTRYLLEVVEGGPARALALRPDPALLVAPPLPDYERNVDHAGIVADLNQAAYRRGETTYLRVCINCHGTKEQPGSLPTSLRFASGVFKNGGDPYRMYQTLTRGFGMMPPQTWMVPRQKYDVIHYIREKFLKQDNPGQYVRATREYLARLPVGSTRGPDPVEVRPWATMDYRPSLSATIEVGDDGTNFAYKGIAVRLDSGPGGVAAGKRWALYEHDTMRLAAAWTGADFIDWNGINFNGRHEVHPRAVGQVAVANPSGPGWANPETGSFADPRPAARDGRQYGPLPRSWAHFAGIYHHGDREVFSYTIGETRVLETPGAESVAGNTVFRRTFDIGPRRNDLVLQVARHADAGVSLDRCKLPNGDSSRVVMVGKNDPEPQPAQEPHRFDGETSLNVERLALARADFTVVARVRTNHAGTLISETIPDQAWVPNGVSLFVRRGRLVFDVGWVGAVTSRTKVDDGLWHDLAMTYEHATGDVRLYVDGRPDAKGRLKVRTPLPGSVVRIGVTAPDFPEVTHFRGEIAEMRVYERTIKPDDFAMAADLSTVPGAIANWRFATGPDGRMTDESGHGHHAHWNAGPSKPRSWIVAGLSTTAEPPLRWTLVGRDLQLRIPAGEAPLRFTLKLSNINTASAVNQVAADLGRDERPVDLRALTQGRAPRWPGTLTTRPVLGVDDGPFAVDVLTHPENNPWRSQMRFTGFDFYPDGRSAALCTWDGDVWKVVGIDRPEAGLSWQRIASGLFQPLGLKLVGADIFVTCRDQLARLHDLDGDGEVDFVENFNGDQQVTEHFHEFAMGLQTDAQGNFYYAKAARHGKPAVVPQHGTLLRVSADGTRTDILATGFRAPNGVCVNGDGTFFVTDQEGFWNPKNRINWVRPGRFYGNMWGYHDVTDPSDTAMEPPVCWITNAIDRSPSEILRVESDAWGPLKGALLSLSYGYGKIFIVPNERVGDQRQGGVCALPIPQLPTGLMRGRFHPVNGQLYVLGMYAWAGTQTLPGGFYRIRATGKPVVVPSELNASPRGVTIGFTAPLERGPATDLTNFVAKTWSLYRSEKYGSPHLNERQAPIRSVRLSEDGRKVTLEMPDLRPTQSMEIRYSVKGPGGIPVDGVIHNTIHQLLDPIPASSNVPAASAP